MPRSDDDDDDRPRNRPWNSKGRDDDDDDRPRRRRDRDDDEEDDRPRRRDRDDDDFDRPPQRAAPSNGLATAGVILGVLSICTAGLAGLPAIICSALALGKPGGRGAAITGLILGLVGTLLGVGVLVLLFTGGLDAINYARARPRDQNNMKQIGLAFHNQHDTQGQMAGPYARSPQGAVNRELSFRVGLLPFIEQGNLAVQFDMTQGWNSPRNRPHSNTPIATFTSPYGEERASTQTPYRVFYGGGALFNEDGKPISLMAITDGTSNTILTVHAAEQVAWAEPREFLYSPTTPLPNLWPKERPITHVLMADGSVRMLRKTVSERTLRSAITRAEGEMMGADW